MAFEITDEFLENLIGLIYSKNDAEIKKSLLDVHYADIAEILDELNFEDAVYIIKLLNSEKTS
jgi:magnesium transporter